MDHASLLELHDRHQRLEVIERGARREAAPGVVRLVRPDGLEGTVIHSSLTEENADRIIAEQVAYFSALGQDFEWKLYGHDRPADLAERLVRHGFEAEEPESFLVLDMEQAPPALLEPVRHDVRRITDPAGLDVIGPIQAAVWGEADPDYIAALKGDLGEDPEHVSMYVAYADGVPVSYARITFQDGSPFGGLWGGSTLKEYRGRGFYKALLAVRLQEARARGLRFLTIDASPMSRPIVERNGFVLLTTTQPFKYHAPGERP